MSATPQNNTDNQEIDLSQISKRIGSFFENIATQVFKAFLFFKRNIIWIGILFVLGAGLGYYFDKNNKVYNNQIIVCPNFGSTDYLYAKISLINSKIQEQDTLFLKEVVGIKNPAKFIKIEVQPISDIYKFIEERDKNFEVLKLMAEDGDVKKIINDNLTSKNYPYHLISFVTLNETSKDKTVEPLLKYFNDSDYYKVIQKQFMDNVKIKIADNDSIISQINGVLNTISSTNASPKGDKLFYYNENSQLGDVLKIKHEINYEQGMRRLDLINLDKIIKDNSHTLNIKNKESLNGKMKYAIPFFFIGIFVLFGLIKRYYKYQMAKLNN
ncbi:hypothetical protein WMW71_01565 [Flavobacterium buctense]|uniref:Polysaccharide chain length determinant N-terminal domain-containing protein n=1 Tax=Flavobacterium buctense TaxID=1648146 RepID=A0ABU9DZB7_9FLAO|nr:hypothetical protein [Flavobacterium buctense]